MKAIEASSKAKICYTDQHERLFKSTRYFFAVSGLRRYGVGILLQPVQIAPTLPSRECSER